MAHQVIELECPGCASSVSTNTRICPYCERPIVISTFTSVNNMSLLEINKRANAYRKALISNPDNQEMNMSIAFCYLKLKLFDKAIPCFEKAIEDNFDNSEVYFYAAISMLKGKKPFLTPRVVIDKIEEILQAAIMIEPKGIYYFFLSYLRYDHHYRKGYNMNPDYMQLYRNAEAAGLSDHDERELLSLLDAEGFEST